MNCGDCLEHLGAFLAGELDEHATEDVQAHLDACSACFKRSQFEEAFVRTLRARLGAVTPPGNLAARIRTALDREDERRAARRAGPERVPGWQSRRPVRWALAAAAVLVVAVVLLPELERGGSPAVFANPVQIEGQLSCLGCLLLSDDDPDPAIATLLPGDSGRVLDAGLHDRLHLRADDGRYWELVPSQVGGEALLVHDNNGRRVSVVGVARPEVNALQVARVSFL